MAETALQFCFLFANLTFELLDDKVNRAVHILWMLFPTQQNPADNGSSHFHLMMFPLNREQDSNIAHVIEILHNLAHTLFHIVTERRRNLDILPSNRECSHETQPLSAVGSALFLRIAPSFKYLFRHGGKNPFQNSEFFRFFVKSCIVHAEKTVLCAMLWSASQYWWKNRENSVKWSAYHDDHTNICLQTVYLRKWKSPLCKPGFSIWFHYSFFMTLSACGPLAPSMMSNSTSCPSLSVL